jgi:prepilin peptidase CpaA
VQATFPVYVVVIAVVIAALTDVRSFRVHNALTLPLLVSGLVYHGIVGGPAGLVTSAYGAMIGLGLLFLIFLLGGMGGGDVKLLAGIGAWLGWQFTVVVLAIASIAAGIYALILTIANGRVQETWNRFQILWFRVSSVGRHFAAEDRVEAVLAHSERKGRVVPFAAMMAVGVFVVLIGSMLRAHTLAGRAVSQPPSSVIADPRSAGGN